jgi:hypothetical protein
MKKKLFVAIFTISILILSIKIFGLVGAFIFWLILRICDYFIFNINSKKF